MQSFTIAFNTGFGDDSMTDAEELKELIDFVCVGVFFLKGMVWYPIVFESERILSSNVNEVQHKIRLAKLI